MGMCQPFYGGISWGPCIFLRKTAPQPSPSVQIVVGNQLGRGYEEVHGKVRTKKTPSRGLHRRVDVDVLVEFWVGLMLMFCESVFCG